MYTVQSITNAWIALTHDAGMQLFSKIVGPYLMFNRTWNFFGILSRREDGIASKVETNAPGEASSPVQQQEEVAPEV